MSILKTTMMVVPEGGRRIKWLRLPKFLPPLVGLLAIVWTAGICWISWNYADVKLKMQWLSQMERENALWEIRLVRLSKRIDRMNGMLGPLEEFNLNLKDRVGIESTEGPAPLKGMGGSDSFLWLKDYHISGNPELLVQLMHRSLDTISKETAVLRHDRIQLHSFLKKQNEVLAAVRPQLPKDARLPLSTHPLAMPIPDKAKSLQILAMDPE